MLNSSSVVVPDYTTNIINDNRVKMIESVEIYQNDVPHQNLNQINPCCAPPDPCVNSCSNTKSVSSSWEWFGLFVLWFIALTVLFWLIYYSLKPPFVLQSDGNQVDTAKVLLAAVISAFVLIVIIWLIKAAMGK